MTVGELQFAVAVLAVINAALIGYVLGVATWWKRR